MKKYFLTGLATLLPLAVTFYVVTFCIRFLTKPFAGIVTHLVERIGFLNEIPASIILAISQILILVGLLVCTILIGIIARWFFIKTVLRINDQIMYRIPFLNKIYKTAKEVIHILFTSKKNSFKQVVMIPFPNKSCYSLGLISHEAPQIFSKKSSEELVSVFIPTTPNPATGFLVISPKSELIFLNMKTDEALKYVLSWGVIQPTQVSH